MSEGTDSLVKEAVRVEEGRLNTEHLIALAELGEILYVLNHGEDERHAHVTILEALRDPFTVLLVLTALLG